VLAYEKGLISGNDNYRTNAVTRNIGRPGAGCVRMGGHEEDYSRPSDANVGRPTAHVDKLLIEGKGAASTTSGPRMGHLIGFEMKVPQASPSILAASGRQRRARRELPMHNDYSSWTPGCRESEARSCKAVLGQ
jgi:hypothetical protein